MTATRNPLGAPRTQAERREHTQAALLDATIESLIENGWAGTTTRGVADRARVSQGAQQHHYPTKAALVIAALERLTQQLAAAALSGPPPAGSERERAAVLLDRLWEIHTLPVNRAVAELLNAAQTDPSMTAAVAQTVTTATAFARVVATQLLPTLSAVKGFDDWLMIAVATMRGMVAVMIPGAESAYADWSRVRLQLLRLLDTLASDAAS